MPWKDRTVEELREEFVHAAAGSSRNFSALCREFGITRKTGYKWITRSRGGETMQNRSRRPHSVANRTAPEIEQQIVAIRQSHPGWGARKIAHVLGETEPCPPCVKTVNNILNRYHCIDKEESLKHMPHTRFEKERCNVQGMIPAELLCPGHPLLEAVIDLVRERNAEVLKQGTIFVDDSDDSTAPRLLFYIEDAIQDGVLLPGGTKRIISQHVHFVELKEDGTASSAGYAPYLDYRAPTETERITALPYIQAQDWLKHDVENRARSYAIAQLLPQHFAEVKARKQKLLDKTAKAVKERLTAEIQYWDYRAADLKQKEAAGRPNARLNSQMAARRAEELASRMQKRLAELETEKLISPAPPVVVGGALVLPGGLLRQLMGTPQPTLFSQGDKFAIELAAMNAVMQLEQAFGYLPQDVSAQKLGYDVESTIPPRLRSGEACLRFIEVKGRAKGAQTVTVSKNEILTGLNKPEEFLLAIVEVDGAHTHTVYLKRPFRNPPDFTATSVNFDIRDLVQNAEVVYEK